MEKCESPLGSHGLGKRTRWAKLSKFGKPELIDFTHPTFSVSRDKPLPFLTNPA